MTSKMRASISVSAIGALAGVAGAILGAGVAWGSLNARVVRLESEFIGQRPVLLRIDRSLSGIEQCIRDFGRRLDRLEQK